MNLLGLRIIRPFNVLFVFLLTLFSYYLVVGQIDLNVDAFQAALSISLIAAAGYTLNDFFDYKVDSKNKPYKPIPSGQITRKGALILTALLFTAGIVVSSFVNSNVFMIAIVTSISLLAYGVKGHHLGLSGDILISFLTALVFINGAFVASNIIPLEITIIALAAFAINISREVIKDIEDYDADKGIKLTFPQKFGKRMGALLGMIFLAINLMIAYIALPLYVVSMFFFFSIPITLLLLTKTIGVLKNPNAETARRAQIMIKLLMIMEFLFVFLDKFVINLIV